MEADLMMPKMKIKQVEIERKSQKVNHEMNCLSEIKYKISKMPELYF